MSHLYGKTYVDKPVYSTIEVQTLDIRGAK